MTRRFQIRIIIGFTCCIFMSANLHSQEALLSDWPHFRGPLENGIVPDTNDHAQLPQHWSETENIAWKTEIPFRGWSTPVILDRQIWLTTATEEGHDFYALCIDADSGAILFNEMLFHSDSPEELGNDVNSYASPSCVMEPGRVYIHFGSYGTACLDTKDFSIRWERKDLPCRHYRGPGSSPILFENLLVLTFDGADQQYLTALDKDTGKTIWRTDRTTEWLDLDDKGIPIREGDLRKAFTTPTVLSLADMPLLVSPGSYTIFAYNARTGEEIWKARNTAYSPALSPIYEDGLLYVTTGRGSGGAIWAMRPDGKGDVTDSHVVWKVEGRPVPDEPSPLLYDGLLFLLNNNGLVSCLDAKTGEEKWAKPIGGNYTASPICANGKLYFCNVQGRTTLLNASSTFEKVAVNNLDIGCLASPAVDGNALILRTKTHLYRIAEPTP
ncbi:MAG: PQQ-binding-like beta-propeller repeat protein [Candidatus Hydrogenedentes bacterium]|jgi:outer membrane protein assembly factor BamB|nr:PQQ-binding-like beta-propeller repeat protein [Candidatus Hydrogenedentota bacterium]